jgi:hypothetical protein
VFLPNDNDFPGGSLARANVKQTLAKLNQRRPLNPRRTNRHHRAGRRIEHPERHQHNDTFGALNSHIAAVSTLLYPTNQNLAAEIGMPAIVDL